MSELNMRETHTRLDKDKVREKIDEDKVSHRGCDNCNKKAEFYFMIADELHRAHFWCPKCLFEANPT
jgi:hypothetical protein